MQKLYIYKNVQTYLLIPTTNSLILGVTVYQPMYILNQSEIVIMFSSGAGVEVIENKGFMSARVYLPWTYMVNYIIIILYYH